MVKSIFRIEMTNSIFSNPVFWIGVYSAGYTITILALGISSMQAKIQRRMPKFLVRIFLLLTFIAPPVIIPFTEGPKLAIPMPAALIVGVFLLATNFALKIVAQRQIGVLPALKGKAGLITTSVYGLIRHPLYVSNGLLAIGMAVLFRSMYALLFSVPYALLYLPIMHFEEKNLLKEYGGEYEKYREEVGMVFPKIIRNRKTLS